ncbi:MAG TPA: DoxX family protein [Acidimicrobiales bacterium]|jgi:putative oxidoreductase|nr:DoxX family protein [Acidimicrobiales bacterium]
MENLPTADQFNFALLVLRLVVGPVFAFHGFAKIFRGGRLDGAGRWFGSIGLHPGHVHARLAASGELATGICITLGFLTTFAGMGLVGLMAVAVWTVHRGNGLLITANGWEYTLVLGTVGVALATVGAGQWSLDNAIGVDLNGPAGFIISLAGGLGLAAALLAGFYRPVREEAQTSS